MRSVIGILIIFLLVSISILVAVSGVVPLDDGAPPVINAHTEDYVLVGGQNGSWFQLGQFPMLYQISLQSCSRIQLDPVSSGGAVWGGGFNGSQFLVSGWGSDDRSTGPYIWLYNGADVVTSGSLDHYGQASSWSGGDIFSASYNGKEWLLSGLGSGPFPPYSDSAEII